jgi:hypothetical protein
MAHDDVTTRLSLLPERPIFLVMTQQSVMFNEWIVKSYRSLDLARAERQRQIDEEGVPPDCVRIAQVIE